MTKVSVFGQETEKKKGKPIEFVSYLYSDTEIENKIEDGLNPKDWNHLSLITKNHNWDGLDVILAYDSQEVPINGGVIFLGHWNDGFVE